MLEFILSLVVLWLYFFLMDPFITFWDYKKRIIGGESIELKRFAHRFMFLYMTTPNKPILVSILISLDKKNKMICKSLS